MISIESYRVIYAAIVLGPVISGSLLVDVYPRLSRVLRILGFIAGPLILFTLAPTKPLFFQLVLTTLSAIVAIGISLHNEGYYKVMYGVSRYFQLVVDMVLGSLILLFSSAFFIEVIIYWFFLDMLIAFIAITMEHGAENLPVASTYIAMCIAPSDLGLLALWAVLAGRYGLFESMMLRIGSPIGEKIALDIALSVVIVSGLAIKLGQFPLHSWPPIVYSRAPSHVSALMSGLVSKMGIYGMLIASELLALDPVAFYVLLVQGLISTVYGSFGAVLQTDLKRILAYSSIAYGGLIASTYAVSVLLNMPWLTLITLLLIVYHGLTKSLAFANTGLVYQLANTYDVYKLGYLYYVTREGSLAAYIALLNMTGIPPSTGYLVKLLLLVTSILIARESLLGLALVVAVVLSAIFSIAYSAKFIGAYLSSLPKITPRVIPIPRVELNAELYLGVATLLSPALVLAYAVITGSLEAYIAWITLPIYALTLLISVYVFISILRKKAMPEDVKYWVSGVES